VRANISVLGLASRALVSRWADRLHKSRPQGETKIGQCPAKLNFGCGYDKREGYLNVDMDPVWAPDVLIVDGDDSAIPRRHFSEVLAKDVLEHIPRPQTLAALLDFADYLILGGKLIIQTSSVLHVAAKLQEAKTYADHHGWMICLFGNQTHPGDFHHTGFTEVTLRTHLLAAGFAPAAVELREEWMFYVEANKAYDWVSIVDSSRSLSDLEFLQHAYQAAFYRDVDETGIENFGAKLREGVPRKQVLKQIFSAPERLYKTANLNERSV
jgi:hypothetical protein